MKRFIPFLILALLFGFVVHSSNEMIWSGDESSHTNRFSNAELPTSPIIASQWMEYWSNYTGGNGDSLRYEITDNTNSTWWEVDVWNMTTQTLNQTSYVKKISGEGGHEKCYAVENYAVYTALGTSHPYQWDKWFDLEGVVVGTDIGPIESEEGESTTLTVNTSEFITTTAGTFDCWVANDSQFQMGFWWYTNYWIDKDSNVTVRVTIEVPALNTILIEEITAASWLTPPIISDVFSDAKRFSAEVIWTTDENANSSVKYGNSTLNLNMTSSASEFVQDHSISITNLEPLTTYYFEIESCDFWGSTSIDNNTGLFYSFTTLSAESPEIITLNANSTSNSTIEIVIDTDKETNVTIWYGINQPLLSMIAESQFATHHEIEIIDLEERAEYLYIVGVCDALGNRANSSLRQITTLDETAPIIINFEGIVHVDSLNLTVETNEDCYLEVYVGQSATELELVDHRTIAQSHHSVLVADLQSYSTVYFKLRLVDPSGNARWYQNGLDPFNRSVPDYLQPEVNHPDDVFLTIGEDMPSITWIVNDQTPYTYEIIVNDVSEGIIDWDGENIVLQLEDLSLGVGMHTIEIILRDSYGNHVSDIVIISISAIESNGLATDENILLLGLGGIGVCIILFVIYRRR